MWDLIVSVPDHCSSSHLACPGTWTLSSAVMRWKLGSFSPLVGVRSLVTMGVNSSGKGGLDGGSSKSVVNKILDN